MKHAGHKRFIQGGFAAMEFHPLANIFPLMEGEEFNALVDDIRNNGLREPVVIYDTKILDGRNRWRACKAAGVQPSFSDYEGDDPVRYVISLNLRRRHLDASQRARVADKLATLRDGVRSDRQGTSIDVPTQAEAAEMFNVGVASVQRARTVSEHGIPELGEAVDRGEASISAAAAVATLPPEQQADIVAEGPEAIKEAAKVVHNHRAQGTGENEWYTPEEHINAAREFMGVIDLDPASSEAAQHTVRAIRFFTADDDGLTKPWNGRVWLNPPYSQPAIANFAAKMVAEVNAGNIVEAVMLTHNYTDTSWFHALAGASSAICFTRGRIGFLSPDGKKAAPTQGQAFFYFGDRIPEFAMAFSRFGFVMVPSC